MESATAVNNDERVRQAREEYNRREDDLKLRHSAELKKMSQKYVNDLQRLRKQSEAQLQDFREKARATLSDKDRFYQTQIYDLRVANRKHLEEQLSQIKSKHANQVESIVTQMKKDRQINKLQQDRLKQSFGQEIQKKDQLHQEIVAENAAMAKKSLESRVGDLRERHQKIQRDLANDRDAKLGEKSEQIQKQKHSYESQLDDTKRLLGNRLDQERRTARANLLAEREAHHNINMLQRAAFKEGLDDVRDRYAKAYDAKSKDASKARKDFENSVMNRQKDRVDGLEQRIIVMKKVQDGERRKMRQELDSEKKTLANAYREQLQGFEKSRRELIEEFGKITHDEVNGVIRKKDLHFKQQMRRMRDDSTTRELINRQALEDLRTFHEERQIHVASQADHRVRSMTEEVNRKLLAMDANFKDRLETQKDDHQETLKELHTHHQIERNEIVRRYQRDAKEREQFYNEKIKDLKLAFQNEKAQTKRENDKKLKTVVDSKDRLLLNQRRAQEKQLEASKLYYEEQARDMRKGHETEIDRLKKGHEDQLRKMIITTQHNANNRKA